MNKANNRLIAQWILEITDMLLIKIASFLYVKIFCAKSPPPPIPKPFLRPWKFYDSNIIYSVLVSVSCPKALYHLESDYLFRITVVVADWLG